METVITIPPSTRDAIRERRPRPFQGGVSLAFVLLVLMGVSGVAVIDPALGVWSVVASGRADSDRCPRGPATVVRIGDTRDAHAECRLAACLIEAPRALARSCEPASPSASDAPRVRARAGLGSLPPPATA